MIKLEDFEAFARTIGALVSSSDYTDIVQLALRFESLFVRLTGIQLSQYGKVAFYNDEAPTCVK